MSDDSGASISDNSSEKFSIDERIRIRKSNSRTITFSRKLSCSSKIYLGEIRAAEITLLEIQNEEAKQYENFSISWNECDLLEKIYQHIIQYIDCCKLQIKTTHRLSGFLNHLTLRENCLTDNMSKNLKKLCQDPNFECWNELSSSAYKFMENFAEIREIRKKFDDDRNNYEIALKNFKMVLEIMSISIKELDNLKKQFEAVLWDYQHSRCLLMKNMKQVQQLGLHFLGEICGLLSNSSGESQIFNEQLCDLLRDLEKAIGNNEKVKKEIFCNDNFEINKTK